MEISLSEKLQEVHVNEKWGQGVFIDGLADYIRLFLKHAFEEAIRLELQENLGRKPYQRSESTDNYRNGSCERDLETKFGVIEKIQQF